jgi:hypothetical protein
MNLHNHQYGIHHFESAKCLRPISCDRRGLVHDFLVQLSLDPDVDGIEFLDRVEVGAQSLRLGAITIETGKHRFLIDFEPTRTARSTDEHLLVQRAIEALGLFTIVVTGAQIKKEPRFSTARAVWSHRRILVPAPMKLALVGVLTDGPSSLHELCLRVPGPIDPIGAVCALACDGTLDIDLTEGLRPETIVRCRA